MYLQNDKVQSMLHKHFGLLPKLINAGILALALHVRGAGCNATSNKDVISLSSHFFSNLGGACIEFLARERFDASLLAVHLQPIFSGIKSECLEDVRTSSPKLTVQPSH